MTISWIATGYVWDVASGRPTPLQGRQGGDLRAAHFSPDGASIVTASADGTAWLLDAGTGQPLCPPLRHAEPVGSAEFSSDGLRVVTASEDHTARIWDAHTGQPLSEPFQCGGRLTHAEFSPDGQWIVTSSWDGRVRRWEVPQISVPVPAWLPRLAEAVALQRHVDAERTKPVSPDEIIAVRNELWASTATDPATRWGQWFFADRSTRTISSRSPVTVPDYVANIIRQGSVSDLETAVDLTPTNALALARLAQELCSNSTCLTNTARISEADCCSLRALQLAPADAEVKTIRARVLAKIAAAKTPANQLSP